jgi:hypothetical protein
MLFDVLLPGFAEINLNQARSSEVGQGISALMH